jgi:hypothetical protein
LQRDAPGRTDQRFECNQSLFEIRLLPMEPRYLLLKLRNLCCVSRSFLYVGILVRLASQQSK